MAVRTYKAQKAALTRAVNGGDPRKIIAEVERTWAEWDSREWAEAHRVRQGAWPDDWHRWQRALFDAQGALLRG